MHERRDDEHARPDAESSGGEVGQEAHRSAPVPAGNAAEREDQPHRRPVTDAELAHARRIRVLLDCLSRGGVIIGPPVEGLDQLIRAHRKAFGHGRRVR